MNQRLHILFLSSWYPSRILPHNGDFIQRHAEAVATKHTVTAIHVVGDNTLEEKIEIDDTSINNVRTLIGYFKPSKNPIIKSLRFLKTYLKLIKLAGNFNLVHLNRIYPAGPIAIYLKWFKNKPFIISEHWCQCKSGKENYSGRQKEKNTRLPRRGTGHRGLFI